MRRVRKIARAEFLKRSAEPAPETAPKSEASQDPGVWVWASLILGLGVLVLIGAAVAYTQFNHKADPAAAPAGAGAQADPSAAGAASASDQPGSGAPPSAAAAQAANEAPPPNFAAELSGAQDALNARLPENRGLTFRGVQTFVTTVGQQSAVQFCGEVNVLNPMGRYVGFQKFISSSGGAKIEQDMTPGDFGQAWRDNCQGAQGPAIWR